MGKTTIELIDDAANEVEDLARRFDSCIVSYSGGKDSRCCAELCVRAFKRVVFLHMYFVPGLQCIEDKLDFARQRWDAEIVQYPHWTVFQCLRSGVYCFNHWKEWKLPDFKLPDVYALARQDLGIELVVRGGKKVDSVWRRRMLAAKGNNKKVADPLRDWHKYEVLYYLAANKIPDPDTEGGGITGVGLTTDAMCWLHDKYPGDYEKIVRVFPVAEAIIKRREWYGIGKKYTKESTAGEVPVGEENV